MRTGKFKKVFLFGLVTAFIIAGALVFYAFARTWNKTEIEFRIHINEKLVQESAFGESPTFAIWLEDPVTGRTRTVFVTSRAGLNDWEGKAAVPVALPMWFEVDRVEKQAGSLADMEPEQLAITGATPKPGYFTTRVRVSPGTRWICRIEVNLAGDFNDTFPEYDVVKMTSDEYKTGQPALVYVADIVAEMGSMAVPVIAGMSIPEPDPAAMLKPLQGITTATEIFDEISLQVTKPKPRIIALK